MSVLFIAGVFLAHAAGRLGGISVTGAILYFASRVVYVPIYAYGIPKLRSVVWLASIIGIILVYASLF
ncbi:MAG: MAPEG family protein [Bdellovibrionota bacterium]